MKAIVRVTLFDRLLQIESGTRVDSTTWPGQGMLAVLLTWAEHQHVYSYHAETEFQNGNCTKARGVVVYLRMPD